MIMSSANGIVPAGYAIFSLPNIETLPKSFSLPLNRCEDSSAQIKFTISYNSSAEEELNIALENKESSTHQEMKARSKVLDDKLNSAVSKSPHLRLNSLNRQSYSASKHSHFEFRRAPIYNRVGTAQIKNETPQKNEIGSGISNEQLLKEHQ